MKTGKPEPAVKIEAREVRVITPPPNATKLPLRVRETNQFDCRTFDPATGNVEPAPDTVCAPPQPRSDGHYQLVIDKDAFTVTDAAGKQLFQQKGIFRPATVGFRDGHVAFGVLYVTGHSDPGLRLVKAATGVTVWTTDLCAGDDTVVLSDDLVFTNCENVLHIVRRSDGKLVGSLGTN
jgi:hypothetical protein